MRVDGKVRIAGVRTVIPRERQPIAVGIDQGMITAEQAEMSGVDSLPVAAAGMTAMEMAIEAARAALAEAGTPAHEIGVVAHSCVAAGEQDWMVAARLAHRIGADSAVSFGVTQMCNGGAMGVQLAISQLLLESRMDAALVITADALGAGSARRWQAGGPLGDGATAVVLSKTRGWLSVRAIASRSCTEHESIFPDVNPVLYEPSASASPMALTGKLVFRLRRRVREAVRDAWVEADLDPKDTRVAAVLLPRVDQAITHTLIDGVLALDGGTDIIHRAAETGHLFAGDLGANIAHLHDAVDLSHGRYAAVINIGLGFTTTCMVVRAEDGN